MFTWYFIFNTDEFDALNLISRAYDLVLNGIGRQTILVTKGEGYGILYDGVFLSLNLNSDNPFEFDGHAMYVDADNNVFLGIAVEA